MENSTEDVEEAIHEATIHDSLPAEPETDLLTEDLSDQGMVSEVGGSGEFMESTEVAAQSSEADIQALEELEAILMDPADEMWVEDSFDDLGTEAGHTDGSTAGHDPQSEEDSIPHL